MIYYIAEEYEAVKSFIKKSKYYIGNHWVVPPGGTLFVKGVNHMSVGIVHSFEDREKRHYKGLSRANTVIELQLKIRNNENISEEQKKKRDELIQIVEKSELTIIKKYKNENELYEDQGWKKPFAPVFFQVSEKDAYWVLEYFYRCAKDTGDKRVYCVGCIFGDKSSLKVQDFIALKKVREVLQTFKIKNSEHDKNPAYIEDYE